MLNISAYDISNILSSTYETIYMSVVATIFVGILGFIIGVLLFISKNSNVKIGFIFYQTVSTIINVIRSIPFIILIILLIPVSKFITGTMLGPNAALPALVIGLAPFYARMVETSLNEVDKGILELAKTLGANTTSKILKFLLPESLPSLISNLTTIAVSMIGFTAIAGIIGAGGLGNLAYLEGFENQNYTIIWIAIIIILLLIFIIQTLGNLVVKIIRR